MSIQKYEAERARAHANLVKQYRPIGPAAIAAAVAAIGKQIAKTDQRNEASSMRRASRH